MRTAGLCGVAGGFGFGVCGVFAAARGAWPMVLLGVAAWLFVTYVGVLLFTLPPVREPL